MKRIAIVDCNNFFVSCERVFNPKLVRKPVVVLSSNDGCIIARSNEAKALGIKMGEPLFACADLIKKHKVFVYSSNFSLYGDMSNRVMQTLTEYAADMEIYSIDEAFFTFPLPVESLKSVEEERAWYTTKAHSIRQQIHQKTGMPVSIGIGPTKTLAKVANSLAKKFSFFENVLDLTQHPHLDEILKKVPVESIWGIGSRYAAFLKKNNIHTAYELRECDESWIRKHLTVNGLKALLELRGRPCLTLDDSPLEKKSITVSRSFGKNITELQDLKEAISYHTTRAAEKLRAQNMNTNVITIFIAYATYHDIQKRFLSSTITLPLATSYTPDLIQHALRNLEKIFRKGAIYKKAGIIFSDFCSSSFIQLNPFEQIPNLEKQTKAMKALDTVNLKMGKDKLFFAASGINQSWKPRSEKKSPAYTTNWHEILTIKI